MSQPAAQDRLAHAAFALFDEQGYERTTIDDIAQRAGLGRTTFFRHYRSKEDVIFPDHERILEQVKSRLRAPGHASALSAAADAARLVLQTYLDEGDIAVRRYALTSSVPALRDREITSVARYQRAFREFLAEQPAGLTQLQAELAAAALVAAHNHVLRRWLRGESSDPLTEFDLAVGEAAALFGRKGDGHGTTVAVFRTGEDVDTLMAALRRAIESPAG
jgi:AcrR family transcriptional regulator